MDQAALAQGVRENLLDRRDEPRRAVGNDEERRGKAASDETLEERARRILPIIWRCVRWRTQ